MTVVFIAGYREVQRGKEPGFASTHYDVKQRREGIT